MWAGDGQLLMIKPLTNFGSMSAAEVLKIVTFPAKTSIEANGIISPGPGPLKLPKFT